MFDQKQDGSKCLAFQVYKRFWAFLALFPTLLSATYIGSRISKSTISISYSHHVIVKDNGGVNF